MGSSSNQVDPGSPGSDVREVAAGVVRGRIDAVWRLLQKASQPRRLRPEEIHQLRVATRRALVALEVFGDRFPSRRREWFERQLRRIRKTAGEARDLDVLTARLEQDRSASAARRSPGDGSERLLTMLQKQRDASRRPIGDVHAKLLDQDWPSRLGEMIARARGGRRTSFERHVRRRLPPIIEQFFSLADRKARGAADLHELRIEGKKLRYALEVCGGVLPSRAMSRCHESLEQLQKRLGKFTDHAAAADRFRRWSKRKAARCSRTAIMSLVRQETKLADAARREFSRWWKGSRRRGLRRRFERMLGG